MCQRQTGHTPAVWFICDVNVPNVDGAHAVCRVHLLTIVVVKADRVDVAMVIFNFLHQLKSQHRRVTSLISVSFLYHQWQRELTSPWWFSVSCTSWNHNLTTITVGLYGHTFSFKDDHCALQSVMPYLWIKLDMHAFLKKDPTDLNPTLSPTQTETKITYIGKLLDKKIYICHKMNHHKKEHSFFF